MTMPMPTSMPMLMPRFPNGHQNFTASYKIGVKAMDKLQDLYNVNTVIKR